MTAFLYFTIPTRAILAKVFAKIIDNIKKRMQKLNIDINQHTIVFDRSCNLRDNLKRLKRLKLNYIGAFMPYHNKNLVEDAKNNFIKVNINGSKIDAYRDEREILAAM